jgi:hypothetical protein
MKQEQIKKIIKEELEKGVIDYTNRYVDSIATNMHYIKQDLEKGDKESILKWITISMSSLEKLKKIYEY